MRITQPSILALGVLCGVVSLGAQAQFFSELKNKAEELVKKTDKKADTKPESKQNAQAGANTGSQTGAPSLGSGPSDELISFTTCAGIEMSNVMVGEYGDYYFKRGFKKEDRSGYVNRQPASVNKGCILPSINAGQIIYMEVDTKAYEAMGSYNDWEMQCVRSDDPGAGALAETESKSEYPYKVDYLAGKDLMLHCGHSEQNVEACAEGSNSSRSGAYDDVLEGRGKTMLSILGNRSTLAPQSGEKLYCQYYNKPSGKSLFAFEYVRTRG